MYFAIRVGIASAIMIGFYLTRGFGSKLETFVMAFAAALAAQGVAFAVKLAVGDQVRSARAAALLGGCAIAVAASIVFVVVDKTEIARKTGVRGILDMSTMRHDRDTHEFVIVDGAKRITVRHTGVLPDQLRDRTEIVAKGQWRGDAFVATDVLAKCPSTYPSPNGPVPASQFR